MRFTQKKDREKYFVWILFLGSHTPVKKEYENASYKVEHIIVCRKQTTSITNTLIKKLQNAAQSARTFYVPIKFKESKLSTLPPWTGAPHVNRIPTGFLDLHKGGVP
jgi:hypothetical protein